MHIIMLRKQFSNTEEYVQSICTTNICPHYMWSLIIMHSLLIENCDSDVTKQNLITFLY
jgi:hypothetical protein